MNNENTRKTDGSVKTIIIVKRIQIDGKLYLLDDKTNIIYDVNNNEEIGLLDPVSRRISITQYILKTEGILLQEECVVCYKNFINIKDADYIIFNDKIKEKYNLTEDDHRMFESETTCLCYDARFECLTCKNNVCRYCLMNMSDVEDEHYGSEKHMSDMAYTGRITCPICRTNDYRLLCCETEDFSDIRRILPEKVLRDIKKISV